MRIQLRSDDFRASSIPVKKSGLLKLSIISYSFFIVMSVMNTLAITSRNMLWLNMIFFHCGGGVDIVYTIGDEVEILIFCGDFSQ